MDEFESLVRSHLGVKEPKEAKMPVFKKVNTSSGNIWEHEKDKTVEGVYIGKREGVGPYGPWTLYQLEKADHSIVSVKNKAQIKAAFAQIPEGSLVRITFLGKGVTKKGQPINNFSIEVAE